MLVIAICAMILTDHFKVEVVVDQVHFMLSGSSNNSNVGEDRTQSADIDGKTEREHLEDVSQK